MKRFWGYGVFWVAATVVPSTAHAHEAYILTREQFNYGLSYAGLNAFSALNNPANFALTLKVAAGVAAAMAVAFWVRHSSWGQRADGKLKEYGHLGHLITRVALAGSFFFSGLTRSILGPEMPLDTVPLGEAVRVMLMLTSGLILIGFLTPLAAALGLVGIALAAATYHGYILTYTNYIGVLFVLAMLGASAFSLDRQFGWLPAMWRKLAPYEATIVRVGYGVALMYGAIAIKFLHPALTVMVVNQNNLTRFHWLFPSDPFLVVLGAAIAEFMIGLLITLGLQVRLVTLVTLLYLTLSLWYFKEAVWPHFLLYGIGLSLLIHGGGRLTLDEWIDALLARIRQRKRGHVAIER